MSVLNKQFILKKKNLHEENLAKLIILIVDNNGLCSVDSRVFAEFPNLIQLSLCYNNIPSIEPDTFAHLTHLTRLELENNKLSFIDPLTFTSLINLELLNLEDNHLSFIDPKTFKTLANLKELYLSNNSLSSLDPETIKPLTNLTRLDLDNNQLSSIDPFIIKGLKKLKKLFLHNNEFNEHNFQLYLEPSVEYISFKKSTNYLLGHNDINDLSDSNFGNTLADPTHKSHIYRGIYVSKRFLGSGNYGQVYLVKHIFDKKLFALKLFNPIDSSFKLTNEMKMLMSLEIHENVIKYFGYFSEPIAFGKIGPGLIMEFCDEGDLSSKLKSIKQNKEKPLEEATICTYLKSILCGLDFLHSKGIVHRDIKPENILFQNDIIKIGDFGFSKERNLATPSYASPEMLRKFFGEYVEIDEKTDIWSAGCVLFEMKTLEKAFDNTADWKELIKALLSNRPFERIKDSETIKSLCLKILIVDPVQRPTAKTILQLWK